VIRKRRNILNNFTDMAQKKSDDTQKNGNGLKVGAGIAIAAAAIAGAYFLYGKDGAKHRKMVKGWALKFKGEVLERIENLPELSHGAYLQVIQEVAKRYKPLQNVDPKELAATVQELEGHWKNISKASTPKKKATAKPRAAAKPAARKTAASKKKATNK
jgi:hypothetical protein